ncbi:MAG: nucleotide exchange factor GrpE [Acidobacteria bacterium]|nr:nucleotide exchange factor GrpE [Acidobacteriota bacterium]
MNSDNEQNVKAFNPQLGSDLERLFQEAEASIDSIKKSKKDGGADDEPSPSRPEPVGIEPVVETPSASLTETSPGLVEEIRFLRDQVEGLQSRLDRLQFEYRNYRERTEREKGEMSVSAKAELLRDLLGVIDVFDWARGALSAEREGSDPEGYRTGFVMLSKQFYDIMERIGLKRVPVENVPFDPEYHQAVAAEESDQYERQTVLRELKAGFLYQGVLLRPAMVKVGIPVRKG